jgi:hypothetical protein
MWNDILNAWVLLLLGGKQVREVRALGAAEGVDAVFAISQVTGFSWRMV